MLLRIALKFYSFLSTFARIFFTNTYQKFHNLVTLIPSLENQS